MIALLSSVMMDIHEAEFSNLGEANINESRYTSIKRASVKLQMYLSLALRCGECDKELTNCKGC